MLVADILRRNATYFGDDDAVVDPAVRTWSWVQLEDRANRLANALLGLGLTKGDRVAVLSPNSPDYVTFFFACSLSGILGAPLNIRLTPPELISYLNYVRPRALLVGDGQEDAAKVVAAEVPSIEHVVGMVSPTFDDFLAAAPPTDPSADVDGTTPYMLGATSGTTGVAKAVVQTNATAIAGIAAWQAELPIAERQTSLQTIPQFFNPGGPAGIHPVLAKGGRTVITPGFEPGLFLRLVRRVPGHALDPGADDDPHGPGPPGRRARRSLQPAGDHLRRVTSVEGAALGGARGARRRVLPVLRDGRDVLLRARAAAREPAARGRRRRRPAPRLGRQAPRQPVGPRRRRRRPTGAPRRPVGRRGARGRRHGGRRLLRDARGDGAGLPGRLDAHGRSGHDRCRWLHHHRRPEEGHHHQRRHQRGEP